MEGFHGGAPPRRVRDLLTRFKQDFDKFIVENEKILKEDNIYDKVDKDEAENSLYDLGDEI